MAENKKYWRGISELENPELTQTLAEQEFPSNIPAEEFLGNQENLESTHTSRRDFLKYMIMPGTVGSHWTLGLVQLGTMLGFVGLFILVVFRALSKAPLMPKNHPMYVESTHFHQ